MEAPITHAEEHSTHTHTQSEKLESSAVRRRQKEDGEIKFCREFFVCEIGL